MMEGPSRLEALAVRKHQVGSSLTWLVPLDAAQETLADTTDWFVALVRPLVEARRPVDDSPGFVALADWLEAHDAEAGGPA